MTREQILRPGDGLMWVSEDGGDSLILSVSEDGETLWLGPGRAWHELGGYTIQEAEEHLQGRRAIEGRMFKCYDEETGASYPDPMGEEAP